MNEPRYGAYDGGYWGIEDALRKENRELAAEVRRLRSERDAVLNMLEGYDVELARQLRAQIAFERGEA